MVKSGNSISIVLNWRKIIERIVRVNGLNETFRIYPAHLKWPKCVPHDFFIRDNFCKIEDIFEFPWIELAYPARRDLESF